VTAEIVAFVNLNRPPAVSSAPASDKVDSTVWLEAFAYTTARRSEHHSTIDGGAEATADRSHHAAPRAVVPR
jgi:hypothetical protein